MIYTIMHTYLQAHRWRSEWQKKNLIYPCWMSKCFSRILHAYNYLSFLTINVSILHLFYLFIFIYSSILLSHFSFTHIFILLCVWKCCPFVHAKEAQLSFISFFCYLFKMFIHVQFVCFSNKHENKPGLPKDKDTQTASSTKPEICLNVLFSLECIWYFIFGFRLRLLLWKIFSLSRFFIFLLP